MIQVVSRELLPLGLESGLPWVTASMLQDTGVPARAHTPGNVSIIYISFPSPNKWLFTGKHGDSYARQTGDVGRKKHKLCTEGGEWGMQLSMERR